ncbi:hypothetical protein HanRHA438_Chr09g0392211 [Helianthus annuus]|nr:hypothetical protein HanIR_Chr09g0410171 [Helianthus annuus]KAJ0541853.1 hypothetical protein HanHA89_Chr09g0333261 [Helianthus annuus]KAJ0706928.1 hypothetical protein HanLR1_Chr09g0312711 [Helianthus annuus]KAJ0710946.1 hypothetical protein HanOQP8_Chr09g0318271 [Helianthus annuus]KAJ0887559.1 hypothetical protein HanRHA438_Chr09g0392211 [Helianthus annuus]
MMNRSNGDLVNGVLKLGFIEEDDQYCLAVVVCPSKWNKCSSRSYDSDNVIYLVGRLLQRLVPEEKQLSFTPNNVKYGGPIHNTENKENKFRNLKFHLSNQKETSKSVFRPAKWQHIGDGRSDRVMETHQVIVIQNKALLHIMLVQSHLQIHQRKEHDVKVVQSVLKRIMATEQHLILQKPKTRVEICILEVQMPLLANSNRFDEGTASRAVEDIDWDSLTVKGTCQEIEKRCASLLPPILLLLSVEARKDTGVKHALAVRAAVTSGNYVSFFKLYKNVPNLNTCLMDLYVEKMRYAAVKSMTHSYRPTLPVSYVAQILGFQSAEPSNTGGLEECTEWLKAHGACLATDNSGEMMPDAKASMASLFMPEPDDAVAHGDASLAINDFLTRIIARFVVIIITHKKSVTKTG